MRVQVQYIAVGSIHHLLYALNVGTLQHRLRMQPARNRAQQPLVLQSGILAIESKQVMKIQGQLGPTHERTIIAASGQISVAPSSIRGDLVEKDINPWSRLGALQ